MAFGMSPFPLRFGSRQGGGGAAAPLAASQLRTDLAAFGFGITRSGAKHSQTLGSGLSGVEGIGANAFAFERVTIGSRDHLGLLAMPGATPLVANSNNLSGWSTTGSPSVVYTASGGLNDAGYTTITGTGGAWTVSNALTSTSGNRTSRVRCFAPGSNAGAITLSQDNGSTTATVTEDSQDTIDSGVALTAQTSANPTLQVAGSGTDTVIIYDFQHGKPASGVPAYKWHAPQGGSPAAVGADDIIKVLGADLADIDMAFIIKVPPFVSPANFFFAAHAVGTFTPGIELTLNTSTTINAQIVGGTPGSVFVSVSEGEVCKIAIKVNGSECSITKNDGTPVTGAPRLAASGINRARIGCAWNANRQANYPILAVHDVNGNVLGEAGATWNAPAFAAFETTL